ncbi:unknown [Candidatus Apopatosoma intestinale]|nr:unknown [Candidatus Apopatosoma intestinale]
MYFYVEPYDFAEFFYLLDVISVNNGEMVAVVSLGERVTELSCASLDFIVNGRRTFDVAVRTAEYFAAS